MRLISLSRQVGLGLASGVCVVALVACAGGGDVSAEAAGLDTIDPGVISVGGTNTGDILYSWSEHGPWVQVSAPGCNVAPLLHDGYGEFCGTSSATPLVAGLAGYLLSVRPIATPSQLIAAIEKTARRVRVGVHFGRINAAAALAALGR